VITETLATSAARAEQAGYTVQPCGYCKGWLWAPPPHESTEEFNVARAFGKMWCSRRECEKAAGAEHEAARQTA
jgi:hypothetical protein